ncbi:MAG: amidohydrolase family protein [Dehalococcoidia bacterium]|jgi:predicted TIM-barrel fold metal-dependent hydrolase|nr:amidohydrolase family protein [Dehalococcoidia bacterium]
MPIPEVIDVHVHLCRSTEELKKVWPRPGFPDEWLWGCPDNVIQFMNREGISHLCTLTFMDTHLMLGTRLSRLPEAEREGSRHALLQDMKDRVCKFNTWGCQLGQRERRIIPFAAIDIGLFFGDENAMMEELEDKLQMGAKGVKVVPTFTGYLPGDRRMFPLYERMQEVGLPVLSDSGTGDGLGLYIDQGYGEPANFADVFRNFPRLKFILAHLPSAYWDQRLDIASQFPQVYFDTSGGFSSQQWQGRDAHRSCAVEDAARLMRSVGIHRVLFGSDGPMADFRLQFEQIMELSLLDEEKRRIFSENARELLELT